MNEQESRITEGFRKDETEILGMEKYIYEKQHRWDGIRVGDGCLPKSRATEFMPIREQERLLSI